MVKRRYPKYPKTLRTDGIEFWVCCNAPYTTSMLPLCKGDFCLWGSFSENRYSALLLDRLTLEDVPNFVFQTFSNSLRGNVNESD